MAEEKYPLINGYDPKEPLVDLKRELFVNETIRQDGNKAKAWKIIYMPELCIKDADGKEKKIPRSKSNYPYMAFKGKRIQARYKYLVDQHLEHIGIDTRHLLMKSAKLVDFAVTKRDITGFTQMVNTIMKLKGEDIQRVAQITQEVKISPDDVKEIKDIFENL